MEDTYGDILGQYPSVVAKLVKMWPLARLKGEPVAATGGPAEDFCEAVPSWALLFYDGGGEEAQAELVRMLEGSELGASMAARANA